MPDQSVKDAAASNCFTLRKWARIPVQESLICGSELPVILTANICANELRD